MGLHAFDGGLSAGAPSAFAVEDMKLGRVELRAGRQYLTVGADGTVSLADGAPCEAQNFQWIETPTGKLVLMAIANNCFVRVDSATGEVAVDSPRPLTESGVGTRFIWM